MSKFTDQPIIVPWDYSDLSKDALAKAVELAESNEQIQVVHVTPYPAAVEPSVVWGAYNEEDICKNLSDSFRTMIPESMYPGIQFTSYFGDPGSQISEHCSQCKAGLIVLSSHGRSGIQRMFIGSVAERVVRLAPCPVLVLRPDST